MIRRELIASGLKISYLISSDFNSEKAIVFLPGWKSPVDLFCGVMGDTPNLLAINLPGWGGSEMPKETWGLFEYAKLIKEVLSKLNINNPILIGHSIGGAVAVDYLNNSGRASKLILIGGAIIRERIGRSQRLFIASKVFRFLFPFVNKKMRQRLAGKSLSLDYLESGEMENIYKRLISEDRQEAYSKLNLPITLIWGRNDDATPYSYAERLRALNNQAVLETISGAGHYCFLDKPEEFKKILFKYL
ncbi:MAG: alpha/beta fold hydrolase [Patescibacteria group bacterium]